MSKHIERMQVEKQELDTKLSALQGFLSKLGADQAPLLTDEQVEALEKQQVFMQGYSGVLQQRIDYDSEYLAAIGG